MASKTCVTIAENTPVKISKILSQALRKSDYAELRLDYLEPIQIPICLSLVRKQIKKCVCTLRPKSEGGKFSGTEKERIAILKLIAEFNPYLLDVEYNTLRNNKELYQYLKKSKTRLLVSWHDFNKTPGKPNLKAMFRKMSKFSNNIKIVTTARSIRDTVRILSLYKDTPKKSKLISFAMGDYGRISRVLCTKLGSPYTYVSLGKPIAPGQFSLDEMKEISNL